MSAWTRDLAIGKTAENAVLKLYEEAGFPSELNEGPVNKRKFFDITSTIDKDKGFTTEVKYDIYANRSGNIAIETFNPKSGKPSGLGATTANFWAHMVTDLYIASVKELKRFVEDNPPKRLITAGGDGNATLCLYDMDHIMDEVFINFSTLHPERVRDELLQLWSIS